MVHNKILTMWIEWELLVVTRGKAIIYKLLLLYFTIYLKTSNTFFFWEEVIEEKIKKNVELSH